MFLCFSLVAVCVWMPSPLLCLPPLSLSLKGCQLMDSLSVHFLFRLDILKCYGFLLCSAIRFKGTDSTPVPNRFYSCSLAIRSLARVLSTVIHAKSFFWTAKILWTENCDFFFLVGEVLIPVKASENIHVIRSWWKYSGNFIETNIYCANLFLGLYYRGTFWIVLKPCKKMQRVIACNKTGAIQIFIFFKFIYLLTWVITILNLWIRLCIC